jgi:5-methylcytosine-specific restriction endonuclease McrA
MDQLRVRTARLAFARPGTTNAVREHLVTLAEKLMSCPLSTWQGEPGRCRWCNVPLEGRRTSWCSEHADAWMDNHYWAFTRKAALSRDNRICVRPGCGSRAEEVNHIEPILGKHSQSGCWHHLDNLESLCKPCHLETTQEQRTPGKFNPSPVSLKSPSNSRHRDSKMSRWQTTTVLNGNPNERGVNNE